MVFIQPAKSWAKTLRLPKSPFPHQPSEQERTKYLQKTSPILYKWQSETRAQQEPFILHDGPPYANGPLHIGHALNKILKDMILRVKVQQGKRVVYVPGWDCHGLPIELKALEKVGHQIQDHNPLKDIDVRNVARKLATRAVAQQMKGFQSWGVMADFDSHWKTMDKDFEIKQLEVFREMARKGLISRRHKPVYWSPSSKTALAETELEYKDDHESTAAYVSFRITKLSDALRGKLSDDTKLSALIWTTTPWTLPANKAIAVHSQLEYCIVTHGTDNLIIAKSRLQETFPYAPIVVDSITGAELEGTQYLNALGGRNSQAQPIIHADFVSADCGSGLVHCAPGHGMDDYEVCTRLGIEAFAPVDDFGCFTQSAFPDDPEALKGEPVLAEGSLKVLKLLGDKVILTEKHKHRYPYDERKNLPVIIRATEQWFADVRSIKNDALQRLKAVHFIPDSGQRRLESFVKGRSEWCISRQRAWGVPIPALYRKDDGVAVLTDASISHILKVIDEKGMDAWWIDAPNDPAWVVPGLIGEYIRGKDTMDVWFDSGSSWTQTAKQADLCVEGTDQHRGWFQSSLLTHVSTSGKDYAPYKAVLTHGFVLDNFGKKMSKSLGNVISPDEVMSGSILDNIDLNSKRKGGNLGVDVLRLWVANNDYTKDIIVGQPVLQTVTASYQRYRLVIKLLLGCLSVRAESPLTRLDQIALVQLKDVMIEVASAYDNYDFNKAAHAITRWLDQDFSAFYMNAIKDRLYCDNLQSGVLEEIFYGLLRMLAPITPTLVEEAWSFRPEWMKDPSSLLEEGHNYPFHNSLEEPLSPRAACITSDVRNDIPWLLKANAAIKKAQEKARKAKLIGSSLQSSVILSLRLEACELFDKYNNDPTDSKLAEIFVVSSVDIAEIAIGSSMPREAPVQGEWSFSSEFDTPGGKGVAWVLPPKEAKCPRCWRYVAPIADELCDRCQSVVNSTILEIPNEVSAV